MFDVYASLGNNCEVAFQLRRVLAADSSSFFSWNVTTFPALLSLLEKRFHGILEVENLQNHPAKHLMHDASHDFFFHSPFVTESFQTETNFAASFDAIKSKCSHLIGKFAQIGSSSDRVGYFYKTEDTIDVQANARRLRDNLDFFHPAKNYVIVLIQHRKYFEPPWGEDRIYNRYLPRLAPWDDATDGHVASWDKIFKEFPHRNGLRLAGY